MSERSEAQAILLVEADPLACALVGDMLMVLGYAVTVARSAEEAIEYLSKGTQFAALVTDVTLPGTSGIELGTQVHQMDPAVQIIFTTGTGYLLAPPLPFPFSLVSKPVYMADLREVIRTSLWKMAKFTSGSSLPPASFS